MIILTFFYHLNNYLFCFFAGFSTLQNYIKLYSEFDPNLVNRFLTCSRILDPNSKLGTHQNLDRYYEKPDFDYVHILRTMDILEEHYDEYISHLYKKSCKIVKRDTSVCFYDCSNYYF